MSGVLVTGATTPLGRALVRALLADGRTSAVLAVGAEPTLAGVPEDPRLSYVAADLTRSRDLRDLLFGPARELRVRAVIDNAHHRSVRARGERAHALNVEATRELLRLAERHPHIERFVYVGSSEIYRSDPALPAIVSEEHPIEMSPGMPQRLRDRVEADLTVCARMGLSRCSIAVLRLAELFAADSGSQLADYLGSRVCLRPLGFDPMIEVLSVGDAVRAITMAIGTDVPGVINVPGADVLPLSVAIDAAGRRSVPLPGLALGPLYAARGLLRGTEFDWTLHRWRFRFGGVLDGTRARTMLGYSPRERVDFAREARLTRARIVR